MIAPCPSRSRRRPPQKLYLDQQVIPRIIASGDYTGDGKSDLLWRNMSTGQFYQMTLNGLLVTGGQVIYNESNPDWRIVANADAPRLPAPVRSLPGHATGIPEAEGDYPNTSFAGAPLNERIEMTGPAPQSEVRLP